MKTNVSNKTKGNHDAKIRILTAKAEELGEKAETARKRAKLAKAKFRQARKAFRLLKKLAKQARKEVKALAAAETTKAKPRRRRVIRPEKAAGAFKAPAMQMPRETTSVVRPVPIPPTSGTGAILLPDAAAAQSPS